MNHRVRLRPPLPGSCAGMWMQADEPAWGSAAPATFWVALEQPGPWGNKAFVESRLDPEVGRALESRSAAAGGRALLIRATRDHQLSRRQTPTTRRVYVSGGMLAGSPWLLCGDIEQESRILDLPFDAIAHGDPNVVMQVLPELHRTAEPVALICTNARRDACCARLGRPVAVAAGDLLPGRVWECSHTGGHRFAPTGVVLPTGATLARLTTDLTLAALDAAAHSHLGEQLNDPRHHRGLSHLAPPLQAADGYVRHLIGENDVTALTARVSDTSDTADDAGGSAGGSQRVEVRHRDGRTWHLLVRKHVNSQELRRNSCITGPVPVESWQVEDA